MKHRHDPTPSLVIPLLVSDGGTELSLEVPFVSDSFKLLTNLVAVGTCTLCQREVIAGKDRTYYLSLGM